MLELLVSEEAGFLPVDRLVLTFFVLRLFFLAGLLLLLLLLSESVSSILLKPAKSFCISALTGADLLVLVLLLLLLILSAAVTG